MSGNLLLGITSIFVFGIGAQWLAWRTDLPAILLLLISGLVVGPILGFLSPDQLFGDLLTPFVSISVAIILFEGGLSLRFSELKNTGNIIIKLVTIGVIVTCAITSVTAYYLFDFGWELSILLGAILVVTGPTVINPLLRQVRPSEQVESILKWEGIVIDPIGAMLAVLVFEVILSTSLSAATSVAIMSILKTITFGTLVGLAGALLIYFLLKRHLLPDFLQNPVNLMIVVAIFTLSNMLQHESGLWATTVMGIALANQKAVRIHHIIEFKENLRVLLLSALFILLAARIELSSLLAGLNINIVIFLLILIFVCRPLSVYLSTLFSDINWREKVFLSWMAPRGVVAASVSSIFAISLMNNGFEQADQLVPIVFIVIISTVVIYGIPASWVARKLGVAKPVPNGLLILGAHEWSLAIAEAIKDEGFYVMVADSNWKNIAKAKTRRLQTYQGNVLSERALDQMNLDGIGRMLSLTANDEVNSLAALRFGDILGRSHVFQLAPSTRGNTDNKDVSDHLSARLLFHEDLTFEHISKSITPNGNLSTFTVSKDRTLQSFKEEQSDYLIVPLFVFSEDHIKPYSVDNSPVPSVGDNVLYVAVPKEEAVFASNE